MPTSPEILKRKIVARTRLFRIEQLDLRFSNGVKRIYERLIASGYGAVVVVPVNAAGEVVLICEYGGGSNRYQWGLPKGAIDPGEDNLGAANRELQEEAGWAARQLTFLKNVHITPSYMERSVDVVLAQDLYEQSLPGDEPEPMEVMTWPLDDVSGLLAREDVSDSLSISALYIARDYLHNCAENT